MGHMAHWIRTCCAGSVLKSNLVCRSYLLVLVLVLGGCSFSRRVPPPVVRLGAPAEKESEQEVEEGSAAAEWSLSRRLPPGATEIPAER